MNFNLPILEKFSLTVFKSAEKYEDHIKKHPNPRDDGAYDSNGENELRQT